MGVIVKAQITLTAMTNTLIQNVKFDGQELINLALLGSFALVSR